MSIDRRELLKGSVAVSAVAALPRAAGAQVNFDPQPGPWRRFEVITRVEIARPEGNTQTWIPLPAVNEQGWFKSLGSVWTTNGSAALVRRRVPVRH